MSDRERVSDERLRRLQRRVEISRVAAVVTDGRESAALSEHATDLAAILAELADARDRIARAAEALICVSDREEDLACYADVLELPPDRRCSSCRARAILTGDADV